MEEHPFVLFNLNDSRYGIEALGVEEIFFLPELTPITEASRDIAGILNLRGEIIPVMDLECRLGYSPQDYKISDSVIILRCKDIRMGMIVNQVYDVKMIDRSQISTEFSHWRSPTERMPQKSPHLAPETLANRCLWGLFQGDREIIMLLDLETVIQPVETLDFDCSLGEDSIDISAGDRDSIALRDRPVFCPQATKQEREKFNSRAQSLRENLTTENRQNSISIGVISLDGEYFGINLVLVREFTTIEQITPIPCCPSHIIGNINLRGEIITLINIQSMLNLSSHANYGWAVIISSDELIVGIVIEKVIDVIDLYKSQIKTIPKAVHGVDEAYLQGTLAYREKMITLLDLRRMLSQPELRVNQLL